MYLVLLTYDTIDVFHSLRNAALYAEPWQLPGLFAIDSEGTILQCSSSDNISVQLAKTSVKNTVLLGIVLDDFLKERGYTEKDLEAMSSDDQLFEVSKFATSG